ncbi:MAG: CARDB domain-containing protein [Acidobacteriota bacterium]
MGTKMRALYLVFGLAATIAPGMAAPPVLHFSDLTSGPRTGNSDSSGGRTPGRDGAIVTIWGTNLGSSRGSSKVYCNGVEAASYYSWGDATSPANLSTYHKMQTISFQVSQSAQNGLGQICVVVDGLQSNGLPFTVRSGGIFFAKTSGNDGTGSGSWGSPWRTIVKAKDSLSPGDIAYICDGVNQTTETDVSACVNLDTDGTAGTPKALVVYPGARSYVGNTSIERAFHVWNGQKAGYSVHWVVAKFDITTGAVGVNAQTGFRVVGNHIRAPNGDGMDGAIYCVGSDVFALGNELESVGSAQCNKLYHTIYVTGVRQDGGPRAPTERNREVGWNYIHDNLANRAINIYSEQDYSAYIQQHRIHDNVIVNQRGDGILLGYYVTAENWIYNNLIVRAGLGPEFSDPSYHTGIRINTGHESVASTVVHCYNNTLYGCGWAGAAYDGETGGILVSPEALAMSGVSFRNNIVYSTGEPYMAGESGAIPPGDGRNCWFGNGAAPGWDAGAVNADPLFVNAGANDFRLTSGSPCRDTGVDLSAVVARDILGTSRSQGPALDIGPFEFIDEAPVCRVSCSASVPSVGLIGAAVAFQATAWLIDCPGGEVAYMWEFGDGDTAAAQNASHTYGSAGTYYWTLTTTAPGARTCSQSGSITIYSTAMPDLTGAWTSVKKRRAKVNATFSCRNTGIGGAAGFIVRVYFSNKAKVSRKSTLVKTQSVPSLAAGGSVAVKVTGTPSSKHKHIIAVVDSTGAVAEANESNNTVAAPLP